MYRSVAISCLSIILFVCLVGSVEAACPLGDLNRDCRVDLLDLQLFAEKWLGPPESSADLNGDDSANMIDFALMAEQWGQTGIALAINEVMASNSSYAQDPQGQHDDWIEIYNYGPKAVDAGGMYLTDNLSVPKKWRIPGNNPAATTIPAGGYLLVWADNDTADAGLHANFKLDANGEDVALFDSDGATLIDSLSFPDQTVDISFGRYPDANDSLRFLALPSPGGQNNGAYFGEVADTQFSHKRGFYDTPFSVTVATDTKDAIIYYTIDGTEPYLLGGRFPTGSVYTGPIPVSRNTCLRAKAVRPGWKPSEVETQTYIFLDDVVHQSTSPAGFPGSWGGESADYQMDPDITNNPFYGDQIKEYLKSVPTISLVTTNADLFDTSKGIYANWNSQGTSWERPASIELINPDGTDGFGANCGVRIYGGVGRREKKKSFRILFKGMYGPTKLTYPLFGEDAAGQFDTIILRANFNDGYPFGKEASQLIRDEFCRRLQLEMGHPSPHGRFVHLYVNGLYWGLYNPVERPDASFAASYLGGDKEDWDAYNSGSAAGDSTMQSWNGFRNALGAGIETSAGFQRLQGNNSDGTPNPQYTDYLDVDSYIDYMLLNIFVGNTDWPGHNWYGAMNRIDSTGFHFFSWDAEWVIWLVVGHGLDSDLYEDVTYKSDSLCEAYSRLRNNPDFRLLFADHVHRAFFDQGPLYVDAGSPQWNPARPERNRPAALYSELANYIEHAMIPESARWGDVHGGSPRTIEHWRNERDRILNTYMVQRPGIVLSQLRNIGLYPSVGAPVFRINGLYQHGGLIAADDVLSMTASNGTIRYTLDGSDPRLAQAPPQGGSGTNVTLVAEHFAKRVLVPTDAVDDNWKGGGPFSDAAWLVCVGSPGGAGYERSLGYEQFIGLDLREQMYGKNATCYIRMPFAVDAADLAGFGSMTLKVRYDDGFIAYLNGAEVASRNFNGTPTWNSNASASHSDPEAVLFESIDISSSLDALQPGSNVLAIHGMNSSRTSSDFLISAELIAAAGGSGNGVPTGVHEYTGPITLPHSVQVKARVLQGNTWSALNEAVYAMGPVAENLRITEIMYHPQGTAEPNDPNEEFIELTNIGTETINLNLVSFTNGIDFTFPSIELAAGEHIVVVQDKNAFEARYGTIVNVAGQYTGRLGNAGERIRLEDAIGRTILDFSYKDGWRSITDDEGFSLTIIDPANPDPNSWCQKDTWRASAYTGGSPGADDSGILPNPGAIVINEILAHSHDVAADWIEFYNTTGDTIDIGGWFISDSNANLAKYEFAAGTKIGPYKYLVVTENLHFGNKNASGSHEPFALSENGEQVYLSSAENGVLTGYRNVEDFGASVTGVSFGRYYKPSTDNYNFVPMEHNTRGYANADPQVGPIVISEIMYNPDWPEGGSYTNDQYEYIEFHNITAAAVTLYDDLTGEPWKLTDGIEFTFPDDPAVTIPAGGYLLVVKNLAAFSWRYPSVPVQKILGPYDGKLNNAGERVELAMPGDVDKYGVRQYIRVDRVGYSDGSHPENSPGGVDLWPTGPDGTGQSLTRKVLAAYGNDPDNWAGAAPSPAN